MYGASFNPDLVYPPNSPYEMERSHSRYAYGKERLGDSDLLKATRLRWGLNSSKTVAGVSLGHPGICYLRAWPSLPELNWDVCMLLGASFL